MALLARWDGFCLPCGSEQRPLVLTWQGRRGVRAWLAGHGFPDGVLRLTCGCCGGVDVVGWEPEPEPRPLDDADTPPVPHLPTPRSTGDAHVADVMAELAALQETPTGPPLEAQEHGAQEHGAQQAEVQQVEAQAALPAVPDLVLLPDRVPVPVAAPPQGAALPLPDGVFAAHVAVPPARWEPAPEPLSRSVDDTVPAPRTGTEALDRLHPVG